MKPLSLNMGFEIQTEAGPVLKPVGFQVWDKSSHFSEYIPQAPFKFLTDALLGLSFQKMTDFKHLDSVEKIFAEQAYKSLEPYHQLFKNSSVGIKSIRKNENPRKNSNIQCKLISEIFQKKMLTLFDQLFLKNKIDFKVMNDVLSTISDFENQTAAPLLYNFYIQFSSDFNEKLIGFYSFLFHLRSIIAVDHNAQIDDTSFQSVNCDSISNYLPRADYTANDAILFWQFCKLSKPFVGHKDKDTRIDMLFVTPLERAFYQYNHNACCLIDQLPKSFLNSMSNTELEVALYQIQMDWLLGSETGLLFRIREELYGLTEGYNKIFWPEASGQKNKKASKLKLCFEISDQDLSKTFSAA